MSPRRLRASALAVLIVVATASVAVAAPGGTSTGPNTTTKPYVLPVGDGVSVKSLLTVGDGSASNGYKMAGIPDGLGLVRSEIGSDERVICGSTPGRSRSPAPRSMRLA